MVENYAPHELLRTQHPDLNLVAMPNVSSALQALATDEVDAVVGDLASSVWSLRQLKLEGLYVSGETPYRYQLAMAVPPNNKLLVSILDKVLADMSPSEISAIQEHWVGNVLDHRTFWSDVLIYGLPGLLALMIVLAVVIRINRRLSSEIARRVDLEQELRSSEYHYRGLVESLSAIAWEAQISDYTYSYVSPHAQDLLGYPLSHWLIPGFWRNIIHPADLTRAQAFCDREVAAGRDHSVDYRVITADGRCLWVRDIVSLIEHGREPVLRGLMIDISEAKRTEEALRLSEQKFASVFQQCPDILVIARLSDGCLLEVNEAFEEQIGLKAEDVIGQTATDLNIWGVPGVGPGLLQRLQAGSIRNLEMPFRRNNGQVFTGLISAEPFDLDTTPALVVVVRDISQLKEPSNSCKPPKRNSPRPSTPPPTACCCPGRAMACCWRSTKVSAVLPVSTAQCLWIDRPWTWGSGSISTSANRCSNCCTGTGSSATSAATSAARTGRSGSARFQADRCPSAMKTAC